MYYDSCHLTHTEKYIRIVKETRNKQFNESELHLLQQNHPEKIINHSFTKLFQPAQNREKLEHSHIRKNRQCK